MGITVSMGETFACMYVECIQCSWKFWVKLVQRTTIKILDIKIYIFSCKYIFQFG